MQQGRQFRGRKGGSPVDGCRAARGIRGKQWLTSRLFTLTSRLLLASLPLPLVLVASSAAAVGRPSPEGAGASGWISIRPWSRMTEPAESKHERGQ